MSALTPASARRGSKTRRPAEMASRGAGHESESEGASETTAKIPAGKRTGRRGRPPAKTPRRAADMNEAGEQPPASSPPVAKTPSGARRHKAAPSAEGEDARIMAAAPTDIPGDGLGVLAGEQSDGTESSGRARSGKKLPSAEVALQQPLDANQGSRVLNAGEETGGGGGEVANVAGVDGIATVEGAGGEQESLGPEEEEAEAAAAAAESRLMEAEEVPAISTSGDEEVAPPVARRRGRQGRRGATVTPLGVSRGRDGGLKGKRALAGAREGGRGGRGRGRGAQEGGGGRSGQGGEVVSVRAAVADGEEDAVGGRVGEDRWEGHEGGEEGRREAGAVRKEEEEVGAVRQEEEEVGAVRQEEEEVGAYLAADAAAGMTPR